MKTVKIVTFVGARPQFIKAAIVSDAFDNHRSKNDIILEEIVIHTGQHYDYEMSQLFFSQLNMNAVYKNFNVGSGSHGSQTAAILRESEATLFSIKPDWVLVYGDTNSTIAVSLAASKLNIPIIHVEAGLRSYNKSVPEEINRRLTDHLSSLLFCSSNLSVENLKRENIINGVYNVGDVMLDILQESMSIAGCESKIMWELELSAKDFYLATIHRACNTDSCDRLSSIIEALKRLKKTVVLPLHPRTAKVISTNHIDISGICVIKPVSYFDMLILEKNSNVIITDSGGVQKEAYWVKTPCVTLDNDMIWKETFDSRCNQLVGCDTGNILSVVDSFENMSDLDFSENFYGDGHAAEKIVDIIEEASL